MSNQQQDDAVRAQVLGNRVEKSLATLANGNVFTTFGQNLITLLFGQVTTDPAGASTVKLQTETGSIDLCAATTIDTDPIGTMYFLTGEVAVILNGTGNTPIIDVGANFTGFPSSPIIFGRTATADAIQTVQTGTDAQGVINWVLFHIPLEEGAYIEAA